MSRVHFSVVSPLRRCARTLLYLNREETERKQLFNYNIDTTDYIANQVLAIHGNIIGCKRYNCMFKII